MARRADPGRVERLFDLVEEAIRSRAPAQADALLCDATGVAYPVRRGVPDFLQPGPRRRFLRR
ncbi:MAG: hypothetical protein ACXWZZ_03460 [Solirubrobacteraceae bacterium]